MLKFEKNSKYGENLKIKLVIFSFENRKKNVANTFFLTVKHTAAAFHTLSKASLLTKKYRIEKFRELKEKMSKFRFNSVSQ